MDLRRPCNCCCLTAHCAPCLARQVLNLAHCHMLSTLVGVVETMPNLRDVELTDTGIGDADLRLLASNCHHVQCAVVAQCCPRICCRLN